MLDRFFTHPPTLHYMRAGGAGPFLDGFAKVLFEEGYVRTSGGLVLRAAHHVGVWAGRRSIGLADLDDAALARFERHLPRCRCGHTKRPHKGYGDTPPGSRRFLRYLREAGVAPCAPVAIRPEVVDEYRAWMRDRQGLAEATIATRLPVVEALLRTASDDPAMLDAAGVRKFVLTYVRRHAPGSAGRVTSAVRGFLRYLVAQSLCPAGMVDAVPTIPSWKQARLPQYLAADEVERIIAGCDHGGRAAKRDRAMLLLLARLGVRAGDVRALRVDDLDWKRGRLRLVGKGRRETYLPLPQDVGDAILGYLEQRPAAATDHVFLLVRAPFRPVSAGALKNAVTNAIRRAGVQAPSYGPHLLRHSLATRMLREGATLDLIGAVLRHRNVSTTALYSKVDVELLKQIAQPWPGHEVSPC